MAYSTTVRGEDRLFDISNRVIVLTGACGLIGRELAAAFAERGARLVLVDVPAADPEKLAREIGPESGALGMACDVSQEQEVASLVSGTLSRFERIDVLINAHQYKPPQQLKSLPEEYPLNAWDGIIGVNLTGTFLMCREVGRAMLRQKRGSIINFASTYGVVSSDPGLYVDNQLGNPVAYSASKGGVIMLTKYLGTHWADRGVRVNCVTPHGVENAHESGFVRRFTEKAPMRRMMRPSEVTGAVLFLASDASTYATGSNLLVEGGWTAW